MKKILKTTTILAVVGIYILPLFLAGCYTDTIEDFSKFTVQFSINFTQKWRDKKAPGITYDSTNLNDYKEYTDNKNNIERTVFYQVAYWIDSIRVGAGDPPKENVEFESVKYYLYYMLDGGGMSQKYLIGEYRDVKVMDYYRIPHVLTVSNEVAKLLEDVAKNHPKFYTTAEYSAPKSGGSGLFPYIDSRLDVVVKLELNQ